MTRGALIAIEGLDRTGKSTQTEILINTLKQQGKPVELIKFPDRTTQIGQLINKYLTDKQFQLSDQSAHLLFSANRWELVEKINKLLTQGVTVLLDRYVYSGVAYSAAKGLNFQWCLNPDLGLPKPDVVLFLKFKDDGNMKRDGFGDERYEVDEFQKKVKVMFERFDGDDNWRNLYVDGKGIEEVEEEVWTHVVKYSDGLDSDVQLFK
ncbi:unnamed protein product [Ambrosiozyma monospora]|uniref:Unnamed protein product n=1 Tax=Ambrosiozyma monospora TaxID=43982 RepID=A0ACB5STY8_AMBMO|nr:unnamed protein product [Ambrosiozyma monospora]